MLADVFREVSKHTVLNFPAITMHNHHARCGTVVEGSVCDEILRQMVVEISGLEHGEVLSFKFSVSRMECGVVSYGVPERKLDQLEVDGKFFRAGGRRVFLKMVTYGPFPDPQPDHRAEMERIAKAGFNAVRLYEAPSIDLLDSAEDAGLWVFASPSWQSNKDFIGQPSLLTEAKIAFSNMLKTFGKQPALTGVFIANEIPSDMTRWMGVVQVREVLEELIDQCRQQQPDLLYAYASFPTTEYMEPANADFTAMNVYLEDRDKFSKYVRRLHHVAGDRPVVVSEFGLDAHSNGEQAQVEALRWGVEECLKAAVAGMAIYAWSDRWFNAGQVMEGWSFGLLDREGNAKPALENLQKWLPEVQEPEHAVKLMLEERGWPFFSVIVCTYNGALRMSACLEALLAMDYPNYEVVVVNDGSTDHTAEVVGEFLSDERVRLFSVDSMGLSAARNYGASKARGEIFAYTDDDCEPDAAWLTWLAASYVIHGWAACGGPNLPPRPVSPEHVDEAVVAASPGAPTHVMLDDVQAEHLPGCNLTVTREAFDLLGGFRDQYRTAGDDVDFCWRLELENKSMGFSGGAFVWHRRRTTLWRYLKQQYGYGKAEALLMRDHPEHFRKAGGARWKGMVYTGVAQGVRGGSMIYQGGMGTAPYQMLVTHMQPARPLMRGFDNGWARMKLAFVSNLQPWIRAWSRWRHSLRWRRLLTKEKRAEQQIALVDRMRDLNDYEAKWWSEKHLEREGILQNLLANRWEPIYDDPDWDVCRDGVRALLACEKHDRGTMVLMRLEMDARSGGRVPKDLEDQMLAMGMTRHD